MRPDRSEALFGVAGALLVALLLSPIVRSVTLSLHDTIGTVWPFSLSGCHVRFAAGCGVRQAGEATALPVPPRPVRG